MVKSPDAIPAPRRAIRGRTIVLGLVGLVLVLALFAENRHRARERAANELRAMGWQVGLPPLGSLRRNWRRLLDREFWKYRDQVILKRSWAAANFDAPASALHRFGPRSVFLGFSAALADVSALRGLANLERLDFHECPNIRDVGIVSEFKKLKELSFVNSPALRSLEIIQSRSRLEKLRVSKCPNLTKLQPLREMTSLRSLRLNDCPELKNCDLFRGMSDLEELDISECDEVTNIDALFGLKNLKEIKINGCKKLKPSDVAALRAAFPSVLIRLPW